MFDRMTRSNTSNKYRTNMSRMFGYMRPKAQQETDTGLIRGECAFDWMTRSNTRWPGIHAGGRTAWQGMEADLLGAFSCSTPGSVSSQGLLPRLLPLFCLCLPAATRTMLKQGINIACAAWHSTEEGTFFNTAQCAATQDSTIQHSTVQCLQEMQHTEAIQQSVGQHVTTHWDS